MRSLLAYGTTTPVEEKLTLRIKADGSGDIYLPVAWYSFEGTQDCYYDWEVSIDWGEETTYTGFGSTTGIRVGYWLTPLSTHTVTIKPNSEEYGWLRAFWYKGTSYGSSLINIISDKSYKGYAASDKFSWNYFKAYQYYGCTNLINTDEELLPDTLEIIWDYYRYYEYAGCTSLKWNADEKILKTVKAIWNYYRAYQYENCTAINTINMRAINWASVGSNYRYNQFNWMWNDRNPMSIYIEWGIEEWGDWGLNNSNVKGVYVFKDLVSDYQTKLSSITSSKIQKNADWDDNEYEFIEIIALADSSGKIRIPVGWVSTSFSQNCAYDWMVSVDWWEAEEITGTGSATYVSVWSWLTEWTEHRVIIKPKTIWWGWGRAFWYLSTGAQAYIKELIHDSYKCYATSRVDTGAHYKHATYTGCTNLTNSYEKLPTSVTTIGDYYMKECYAGCTSLTTAFWEIVHSGATLWTDYRHHEYTGCTALSTHQWIAGWSWTYPTNYKYEYLSGAGNNMDVYMTKYEALASWLTNSLGIADNKVRYIYCYDDNIYNYVNNSYWSNITDTKFQAYYYDYAPHFTVDITKYTKLIWTYNTPSRWYSSGGYSFQLGGFGEDRRWVAPYSRMSLDVRLPWWWTSDNTGRWELVIYRAKWQWETWTLKDMWTSYDITYGAIWASGNTRNMYVDYKWNVTYGMVAYTSSNRPYKEVWGRVNLDINEHYSWWLPCICATRNGRYMFVDGKQYYSSTKFWWASEYKSYTWTYTNMEFSDDGMTVYLSTDFNTITQYDLVAPRELDGKTSTWKTRSITWSWAFTKDYKYLYIYDGTLSVYEYQP